MDTYFLVIGVIAHVLLALVLIVGGSVALLAEAMSDTAHGRLAGVPQLVAVVAGIIIIAALVAWWLLGGH
jgi:hypothetical protein